MFNVLAHCGKHTLSFRDGGCAEPIKIEIPNVQSCWNFCVSGDSYNMLWKSGICNCVSIGNVKRCGPGEFEYYNKNPVNCNTGNTQRNIICNFIDAVQLIIMNSVKIICHSIYHN